MAFDLLIKGGRIVDGSGLPGFTADIGISDGRIVEIGSLSESATSVIDADGLVVAPGFIDHHTHLDAQILWDGYGSSEPENGITSIITGNCGLTLAPVNPGGEEDLVQGFRRVEEIPYEAMAAGVPWNWRSYGDYLDRLEGRIGINVGGHVGHIAIRHVVMGPDAIERAATDDEIQQMQSIVSDSLHDGALGLSVNRSPSHVRDDGKPVASRSADDKEFYALLDVLRQLNVGVIQAAGTYSSDLHEYEEMARRTRRPVLWQTLAYRWAAPDEWRQKLDALKGVFERGSRAYTLTSCIPLVVEFSLASEQSDMFKGVRDWEDIGRLSLSEKTRTLSDPDFRNRVRHNFVALGPTPPTFHGRWDLVEIAEAGTEALRNLEGRSIQDIATAQGKEAVDAFLDITLAEDLSTRFRVRLGGDSPDVARELLSSRYVLVGVSDAGAHVTTLAKFAYPAHLLGHWVRDKGIMTIEEAIHRLTFVVASIFGLKDRGLVRPGFAADLVAFDPAVVSPGEKYWKSDFPRGVRHLGQVSNGIHRTIVNGQVVYDGNQLTDNLPGQVLRGPLYEGRTKETAANM